MSQFIDLYPWLLPFIIFFGRIVDVSLGTLRILFVSKGAKYIAPIIGFFEVLIWIVVISEIFSRANNVIAYLSYAAGYATGNYIGILIEQKIAYGFILYRIYTKKDGKELVMLLNAKDMGATQIHASGSLGDIDIIETVVERKMTTNVEKTLNNFDPGLFYVTEDIRSRRSGIFPQKRWTFSRLRPGK